LVRQYGHTKQILIVGDTKEDAPYHPLDEAMRSVLARLFAPLGFVTFTTDEQAFDYLDPTSTDICVSFVDRWKSELSQAGLENIKHFMQEGNLFLVLHHGLSYQTTDAFARMVGARFISHPDMQTLSFTWDTSHPLCKEQKGFSLYEEPYRFELFDDDKQIFLWFESDGNRHPAGWSKRYGKGDLVYLMPGHDTRSFVHAGYRNVLHNTIRTWSEFSAQRIDQQGFQESQEVL